MDYFDLPSWLDPVHDSSDEESLRCETHARFVRVESQSRGRAHAHVVMPTVFMTLTCDISFVPPSSADTVSYFLRYMKKAG